MQVQVSAIVHTRNERDQIEDCLRGLEAWSAEIILCDMESIDGTVEFAQPLVDIVLQVPWVAEFDAARNLSADAASQPWILYLDADERLTDEIKETIAHLIALDDPEVAAYQLPFKTFSFGSWIEYAGNWWPSYKSPPLLRKGRFHFTGKVHDPARVDGKVVRIHPRNDRDAIEHYSHRDFTHYLEKLNRYTSLEVEKTDHQSANWESSAGRMGATMRWFYDETHGKKDGLAGFLLSIGSALYDAVTELKAMERSGSEVIPPSAEAFFLAAARAAALQPSLTPPLPEDRELISGVRLSHVTGRAAVHVAGVPKALHLDWDTESSKPSEIVTAVTHRNALHILGGGEVQLLASVRSLYEIGTASEVGVGMLPPGGSTVHCYSLHLDEIVPELLASGRPYVLTPIFWDRAELAWIVPRLIAAVESSSTMDDIFAAYASLQSQVEALRRVDSFRTPLSPAQKELVTYASAILPNALCEAEVLQRSAGIDLPPVHVIPNAVRLEEAVEPCDGLPDEPFVLCVGRIEPNKNQLSLLLAARHAGLSVVLIGSEPSPGYAQLCRAVAGPDAAFLGPRSRAQVAFAMSKAMVHCLPSFAETPGLVNLEAIARGCPIVCSNRGAEHEYFGSSAEYCDPLDLYSIVEAINKASTHKPNFVPATWESVAHKLAAIYRKLSGSTGR